MKRVGKVIVLGASSNPERYSFKAVNLLREKGYEVIPVNPHEKEVSGISCVPDLNQVQEKNIHTVTVYLRPSLSSPLTSEILNLHPQRVIFNPGAENRELQQILESKGIEVTEACTLVLLRTQQFED